MSSNPFFPEVNNRFGFGCMRLPMIGNEVDIEQFKQDHPAQYSKAVEWMSDDIKYMTTGK